jgi:hypothetical protein
MNSDLGFCADTVHPASTASPSVIKILQFRTSYILSEITSAVRMAMASAIATAIGNSALAESVLLSFTEIEILRRQQRGVLVDVSLKNYQGTPADFRASLTESNINTQMLSLGLRAVQLVVEDLSSLPLTSFSNIANRTSSVDVPTSSVNVPESGSGTNIVMIAIGVCTAGAFVVIAGCVCWRWRLSSKSKKKNVSVSQIYFPVPDSMNENQF